MVSSLVGQWIPYDVGRCLWHVFQSGTWNADPQAGFAVTAHASARVGGAERELFPRGCRGSSSRGGGVGKVPELVGDDTFRVWSRVWLKVSSI